MLSAARKRNDADAFAQAEPTAHLAGTPREPRHLLASAPAASRGRQSPTGGARVAFGRNLILARTALNLTQEALAELAGISRATIAQIETGDNDSRLSTVGELSKALGVSPLLLLLRDAELAGLTRLLPRPAVERVVQQLTPDQAAQMHAWRDSGLQRNLLRVAELGAAAAAMAGLHSRGAAVGAAIGSALEPGPGTGVGAVFGEMLSQSPAARSGLVEGGEGI